MAVTLNNLAALAHATGRHDDAWLLYRRALAIKEKALGPGHPDVAMTLNNLAVLCKSRQEHDEAESLYRRALAIFLQALGPRHLKVAECLENYARLLWKVGRLDEARALKTRARAILKDLDVRARKDPVATATINPQFACFALSVRRSPIHGWGVFAEQRIPQGRKVIEYTGERIPVSEAARRGRSRYYLFTLDMQWSIDAAVGGSGAELINHSCDPNLSSRLIRGHILYFSRRPIEPGEELTVDYAFAPVATDTLGTKALSCHCGSPRCRGTMERK